MTVLTDQSPKQGPCLNVEQILDDRVAMRSRFAVQATETIIAAFMEPVIRAVDDTMGRLAAKRFATDPIVASKYSAITSVVSSAYKRHGQIIEQAIIAALSEAAHLRVWSEPRFCVSDAADRLADNEINAVGASLGYNSRRFARTLQIDLLVYNEKAKLIGFYESKRGFGYHDAGKKRSMLRDLLCVRMLLRSYAEEQGLPVQNVAAHMIFYYGQC